MRAVIQRVSEAGVTVDTKLVGRIGPGLMILVAVDDADADPDIEWLSGKIVRLRIFDDAAGVMNCSVVDVAGDILLISQFTLLASTRKGNRPSYARSAAPPKAATTFERFAQRLETDLGKPIQRGLFGAHMVVSLTNDGPVTMIIDSQVRE